MFEAARVGDDIGHSGALAGMIAGTIVGGLIAAAGGILAGAMFIAGLGASCLGVGVLLVGASLAVGYYTGELSTVLTTARSRWPKALSESPLTASLRHASGIAPPATRR